MIYGPLHFQHLGMVGGCRPTNGFGQFVNTRLFIIDPTAPARVIPELKSSLEYTERRPLNRHEVQAESKIFRSRIVGKSSYPYWGIENKVVMVRWFYKGRHMKELLTAGRVTENGAYKQSSMESNIVDTMRCCFKNDQGKMGNLELSIIASVKRYFEEPPPKRPV